MTHNRSSTNAYRDPTEPTCEKCERRGPPTTVIAAMYRCGRCGKPIPSAHVEDFDAMAARVRELEAEVVRLRGHVSVARREALEEAVHECDTYARECDALIARTTLTQVDQREWHRGERLAAHNLKIRIRDRAESRERS